MSVRELWEFEGLSKIYWYAFSSKEPLWKLDHQPCFLTSFNANHMVQIQTPFQRSYQSKARTFSILVFTSNPEFDGSGTWVLYCIKYEKKIYHGQKSKVLFTVVRNEWKWIFYYLISFFFSYFFFSNNPLKKRWEKSCTRAALSFINKKTLDNFHLN